jgi:uncharacterized RDD family membrane protein YckC/DNA-directed RNA polymerase subunit RPC12/RpoP
MAWYYHRDGNSIGPIEAPELQALIQNRTLAPDTMVWTDGMAEWTPFQKTTLAASQPGAVSTVGTATHTCVECGKPFPTGEMLQYENSWVCPNCKPIFFQRIKEGVATKGQLKLATIGRRFVAVLCDGLLIGFIGLILLFPMYSEIFRTAFESGRHPGEAPKVPVFSTGFTIYQYVVSYGLPAAYEIFFIGAYGATLGKMMMKIKVVSPEGGPISYGRATGRHFAKLLSGIILYIGYLMAFWDDEKRALHDRICNTRVISSES